MNKFKIYLRNCKVEGCTNIFRTSKKTAEKCPEHTIPVELRPVSQIGIPKFKQDLIISKLREKILTEGSQ